MAGNNLYGSVFTNFFADIDQNPKPNQPLILDTVTLQKIYLQTIPQELMISPESSFATVNAPGANIPRYHFTGGEDIIQFVITWYAMRESKSDVLARCKFVESLARADGSRAGVRPVKFIFGRMFIDSTFIVSAAPYRLSLFDRSKDMYPTLAIQEITLKRVSNTNPTRNDILSLKY